MPYLDLDEKATGSETLQKRLPARYMDKSYSYLLLCLGKQTECTEWYRNILEALPAAET